MFEAGRGRFFAGKLPRFTPHSGSWATSFFPRFMGATRSARKHLQLIFGSRGWPPWSHPKPVVLRSRRPSLARPFAVGARQAKLDSNRIRGIHVFCSFFLGGGRKECAKVPVSKPNLETRKPTVPVKPGIPLGFKVAKSSRRAWGRIYFPARFCAA